MKRLTIVGVLIAASSAAAAQPVGSRPASSPQVGQFHGSFILPVGTMLVVTPSQEISSKHIEEGERLRFQVVQDVVEANKVVISRGTPVVATVTWKTGRAIGGKSGKFEVQFNSVNVGGRAYALNGSYRQEGRGNSVGALLGSMVISGRSAVMMPGQLVNVFTAEPLTYW